MDMDFLGLLDDLESHLAGARKVPFTSQVMLDPVQMGSTLQALRDAMPDAIRRSNQVLQQESRILIEARQRMENTMAEADAKAKALRLESEQRAASVNNAAREQSETMLQTSQRQADEILSVAERRADEAISQTAITFRAEQQAHETVNKARGEAQRVKMMANDHAVDLFHAAEEALASIQSQLRDARNQLDTRQ